MIDGCEPLRTAHATRQLLGLLLCSAFLCAAACDRYDLEGHLDRFKRDQGVEFAACGGPRDECDGAEYTEIFDCLRDHHQRCAPAEARDQRFSAARNDDTASYFYFIVPADGGGCEVVVFAEYMYGDGSKDLTSRTCAEPRFSQTESCLQLDLGACGAEQDEMICDVVFPTDIPPFGC